MAIEAFVTSKGIGQTLTSHSGEPRPVTPTMIMEMETTQALELGILGFKSPEELLRLTPIDPERERTSKGPKYTPEEIKVFNYFKNTYDITGNYEAVEEKIAGYAQSANNVNDLYREGDFEVYKNAVEMRNEVSNETNVINLLLIAYNPNNDKKIRYEAKRKLYLIRQAAANDMSNRPSSLARFRGFLIHLHGVFFDQVPLETIYLRSRHDPKTLEAEDLSIEIVSKEDAEKPQGKGYKITELQMRTLTDDEGEKIKVWSMDRVKKEAEKMLKSIRLNASDPKVAIRDPNGIFLVTQTEDDVRNLGLAFVRKYATSKYAFAVGEVEDNSHGGTRKDHTPEGASNLALIKYIITTKDTQIETAFLTFKQHLDYQYQLGTAYRLFKIRRQLAPDVIDFMYPYEIYGIDFKKDKEEMIKKATRELKAEFGFTDED